MKERRLNNVKIKPIITKGGNYNLKNLKSYKMFPSLYYNLFICSKKKSGKTSLIGNILNECTSKKTTIWLFCATYNVDATWKQIIRDLEKRGYTVNCYDSIVEKKVNHLDVIIEELSNGDAVKTSKKLLKKKSSLSTMPGGNIFNSIPMTLKFNDKIHPVKEDKTREPVVKRSSKKTPEHLFIFDDISTEMRNKAIARLLKIHRHLHSSVICSSQYLNDLQPQSILQLDYFICFRSFSDEKLNQIHRQLDMAIDFKEFFEIYHYATKKPYDFLYLNTRNEEIRRNFNNKIL